MNDKLLHITDLAISFGGLQVLRGLQLAMQPGEVLGLMGPNGSGKSTLFNCIGGQYQADRGKIWFQEKEITLLRPDQIAQLGVARTFQQPHLFAGLTVRDHALLARERHWRQGWLATLFPVQGREKRRSDHLQAQKAERWLNLLGLAKVADKRVSDLPFGLQKRVELLRALATEPELLLLDEPAAGLSEGEREDWVDMIQAVKQEGELAILVIEHQMELLRLLTDRIGVMNEGQVIALGPFEEVMADERVKEAYWGMKSEE
jgi:branched-chain amino acid transport system ATP-binding protein